MNEQFLFQLGSQLTTMQTQIQQLAQANQSLAQQLQDTRNMLEALAQAQSMEYSQDAKKWVSKDAMAEHWKG